MAQKNLTKKDCFLNAANVVTMARIALVFVLASLILAQSIASKAVAFVLVLIIIGRDWYDGYLARKLDVETKFGGVLDIAGDRLVESVVWITFAHVGLVPVWVPIIIISRGLITDSFRSYALAQGMTAFGKKTMMKSWLGNFLVDSRFMRGLYGVVKVFVFPALLLQTFIKPLLVRLNFLNSVSLIPLYVQIVSALVIVTVVLCLVRGVPVVVESRRRFR
jgi:CDP-diacylglycerol--glycerol-3-phosphate 3-phosphatidyltransferase